MSVTLYDSNTKTADGYEEYTLHLKNLFTSLVCVLVPIGCPRI